MRAEGPYYLEYDPNVRVAGNEQSVSSITARYRYLHRTRISVVSFVRIWITLTDRERISP
jgi:hypothetical protein